ncbi:RusA family crossover junction endodeoxyribonuclease [Roseomonas sp. WA12]
MGRNGRIYWGETYAAVAGVLQREFALALPDVDPHTRGVVVGLESIFPKPKKTILFRPKGDTDNLAKSPLDAITKTQRLWEDDDQVERLFTAKRWAEPGEIEGVHLIINTLED